MGAARGNLCMGTITARDGTELFYKDWGTGRPVLFSHAWPLNADMWDGQMCFLAARGYRCIAFDRRGFGRSSKPWSDHQLNTFADDLASVVHTLDLIDIILVGCAMGVGTWCVTLPAMAQGAWTGSSS